MPLQPLQLPRHFLTASMRRVSCSMRRGDRAVPIVLPLVLAMLAGGGAVPGAQAQPNALQDEVRELIASKKLGAARVGVCLIDATTGDVLASVNAADPFTPASNMKLLTSGAAMMVLGPDFAFRTELLLEGERLIVRGAGDPALGDPAVLRRSDEKMTVDDLLGAVASALPKAGVQRVGEVVIDDRVFDREFVHPRWNPENLHLSYSAQVAGLNFHTNVLSVFPRPSPAGPGNAPLYDTQPAAPWLRVDTSKARTVAKGGNTVWLARQGDDNSFIMRGDVQVQARGPADVTLNDVPSFFGQVMVTNLIQAGVVVAGQTVVGPLPPGGWRLALPEEQFGATRPLAVVATPIEEVLRRCNVDSENLYAEALLKRMGHEVTKEPGSWTNGAAVLRMKLSEELGPDAAASTTVSDGSGLSHDNRVTPRTLARWMERIARKPWADEFVDSLATPGEGTLERRFRGMKLRNSVHAKSGYIKGVRCLSGYVTDAGSGDRMVFVVMVNNLPLGGSEEAHNEARELHEQVVQLLDRTLTRRSKAMEPAVGG